MPSDARRGWLIATGTMLAICLFTIWQSWLLALTDKLGPGPGFFPFWLSIIGAAFSLILLIGVLRRPAVEDPKAEPVLPDAFGFSRIGAIVGMLGIASAAMSIVGFELAMLGFNAGLAIALGERRWIVIAVFAVVGSYGVHYVFTRWLDVMLPTGIIGL